jgi:hypothetical protein
VKDALLGGAVLITHAHRDGIPLQGTFWKFCGCNDPEDNNIRFQWEAVSEEISFINPEILEDLLYVKVVGAEM